MKVVKRGRKKNEGRGLKSWKENGREEKEEIEGKTL